MLGKLCSSSLDVWKFDVRVFTNSIKIIFSELLTPSSIWNGFNINNIRRKDRFNRRLDRNELLDFSDELQKEKITEPLQIHWSEPGMS